MKLKTLLTTSVLTLILALPTQAALITPASSYQDFTEQGGISKTTDRFGNADGAYLFDGENGYLSLEPNYTLDDFTMAMYFRADDVGRTWSRLFDFGEGYEGDVFVSVANGRTGGLAATIHNDYDTHENKNSEAPVAQDQWYHLAVSYDKGGNGLNMYLDGELAAHVDYSATSFNDWGGSQNWYLGKSNWGADPLFKGAMSDIYFSDSALTQAQVSNLANPVPEPHAIALFALGLLSIGARRLHSRKR